MVEPPGPTSIPFVPSTTAAIIATAIAAPPISTLMFVLSRGLCVIIVEV